MMYIPLICVIVNSMTTLPQAEDAEIKNNSSQTLQTVSEAVPAKNQSEIAYQLFNIVVDDETGGSIQSNTATKHVVFQEGKVQPSWRIASAEATPLPHFHHNAYVDRINFDFFFGAFANYQIAKPVAKSTVKDVSNPKVIDFSLDDEEHSGSFAVLYDCQRQRESNRIRNTTIEIRFQILRDMHVAFALSKSCGGGQHKYVEFGYFEHSDNEGAEISRVTFPPKGAPELIVGPHVMSTKLYLLLHRPAESQEFFHTTVRSSSPTGLSVSLRGPAFGGVLQPNRPTILYVQYECHTVGKQKITLTVPLRPFDDITASWTKDCGGGIANGLSIGTDAFTLDDVVQKGMANRIWSLALKSTSGRIDETAPVVNSSVRFKDFWLSNNGIALHIAPEIITIEKPEVVTIYGQRTVIRSSGVHAKQSGVMAKNEKMRLRLRMICKKKGRSLVLVTFPVKSFEKIDFGFVKECRAPRQHRHSGFLRTANSVMFVVSVFMVMAFATCWRYQSDDRKNNRFGRNGHGHGSGKVHSTFEPSEIKATIFSVGDECESTGNKHKKDPYL